MKDEIYDHIDEKGNIIGQKTWSEVHKEGLLHQTCAAFMFKDLSKDEVLIQRRSGQMTQDPSKITLSVGGHILSGHTPEEGIKKELEEELFNGKLPENIKMNKLGIVDVQDIPGNHELLHLYEIIYWGKFNIDPKEVENIQWISIKELLEKVKENPDDFTNAFKICLGYYLSLSSEE